jgi:hypothetical protein
MSILLGFEIPTGKRVEIPDEGHAAFFGQTQLSGKTTLIEAITYRAPANVKAVAFITKRGEGSFLTARTIPPYFSEPTNDPEQPLWRWVSAILEASQQRKLRFEEAWIIRACEEPKRAKSLADVHANIKVLLDGEYETITKGSGKRIKHIRKCIRKPVSGINQGVYTSLKAYFDIVMPQLERMPYTKTLDLKPGLNVMDLREYSMEAQGMVIRSVMEYVYRHERNTRVIVPEAQDFVPQGRNSPVKMACETMVRKGAADKNFMWLDSQDMAAVDKVMLRAVSILGCGVQGEAHEMGRAIAHLFGVATRLTPRDIGSLKIGQFYLRLAGGEVTKCYVQPAWMDSEVHARAIAMGQESVASARQILNKFKQELKNVHEDETEDSGRIVDGVPQTPRADVSDHGPATHGHENPPDAAPTAESASAAVTDAIDDAGTGGVSDDMWREKYEALKREFDQLTVTVSDLRGELMRAQTGLPSVSHEQFDIRRQPPAGAADLATDTVAGNGAKTPLPAHDLAPDEIYSGFDNLFLVMKAELMKDPAIMQLLANRPELRVNVQRTVIELDDSTLPGRVASMIAKGFFKEPRTGVAVANELKRLGMSQPKTNVYRALDRLNEQGFLTAEPDGYQAVEGMKVNIVEHK